MTPKTNQLDKQIFQKVYKSCMIQIFDLIEHLISLSKAAARLGPNGAKFT